MKRLLSILKGMLGLLTVGMLAIFLVLVLKEVQERTHSGFDLLSPLQTPTPRIPVTFYPSPPTSTPPSYAPVYSNTLPTATPYPGEKRPPAKFSTPTPLPISKVVDLAKGLPDEDKVVYIIRRVDGVYEKYLLPYNCSEEKIKELMDMGPQDLIIRMYPLKPLPPSTPILTRPVIVTTTGTPFISPLMVPTSAP